MSAFSDHFEAPCNSYIGPTAGIKREPIPGVDCRTLAQLIEFEEGKLRIAAMIELSKRIEAQYKVANANND
jgi:hypothetical protein